MNSVRAFPFYPSPLLPLAACAALAACQPVAEQNAADNGATNETMLNVPSIPRPQPPMDRAAILTAVARAASAISAGVDDTAEQRSLDGSPFEFRIRFGCRGPSPDVQNATFGWALDRESGTLRVRATPTISPDEEIVQRIAGEDFEAAEGFWVPRPWFLEPACPAPAVVRPALAEAKAEADRAGEAADVPAPAEDEQETRSPPLAWPKVGIAQFFTKTDPRTGRQGMKPYDTIKKFDPAQPISLGFNLVLSGRLRSLPGQRVIACVSRSADAPPDCVVSARIDRVRLERPDTKELLAEWGSS